VDVELSRLLTILWRRRWIIVAVLLVATAVLAWSAATRTPMYEARVRVQLLAPMDEEVIANRAPTVVRLQDTLDDLLTVTRNNYMEALKSAEAGRRTLGRLREPGRECAYALDVNTIRDSNFLDVVVRAPCRDLVATIANARVDEAIAYYRQLRGLGVAATIQALRQERESASEAVRAADEAFASFRRDRGIGSIGDAIRASQDALIRLEADGHRGPLDRDAASRGGAGDSNRLAAKWKATLGELIALEPQYRALEERVVEARRRLEYVASRQAEVELRSHIIERSGAVQRVDDAQTPTRPTSRFTAVAIMALCASLGAGIVLALLVDSLVAANDVANPKRRDSQP
jgi:uncharacterized protein involved in exopolysaccharide biosynthesis